ncbi:MAG: secondary thiamine-phosphate synthase enzyme YjbQ [Verrucomicrobiota bacterium]
MSTAFKSVTDSFSISTSGKGTYEITDQVANLVRKTGVQQGTVTVFMSHTSASLIIYENADPSARTDLHRYFEKIAPEDDPDYLHTAEGPDDMPSHLRMVLTRTSEVIPILRGQMTLGTWQGIFVFEHRSSPHRRTLFVNISGV